MTVLVRFSPISQSYVSFTVLVSYAFLFKRQPQRAQATLMPVKSITMNIYMLDNETMKQYKIVQREIKWQSYNHYSANAKVQVEHMKDVPATLGH